MKFFKRAAIGAALMFLANSAHAATLNTVIAQSGCGGPADIIRDAPSSVTASANGGTINCTTFVESQAGGGFAATRGTINGSQGGQISGTAQNSVTDIYLTPLFDVNDRNVAFNTNFLISVAANLVFDGTVSAAVDAQNAQGAAGAALFGFASLTGFSGIGAGKGVADQVNHREFFGVSETNDSDSGGTPFSVSLIPEIKADWRLALGLTVRVNGDATNNTGFGNPNQTSTFDGFNTLSFSKTGPAFFVPAGFTVNEPELNIINNRWIDPRAPINPSPVPLPASLPLLLAGGFVLVAIRRFGQKADQLHA